MRTGGPPKNRQRFIAMDTSLQLWDSSKVSFEIWSVRLLLPSHLPFSLPWIGTSSFCQFIFFLLLFFRVVLSSQQNRAKGTEISRIPPDSHVQSLPDYQDPSPEGCTCYTGWAYIATWSSPKSIVYLTFTCNVVHPMGLDTCVVACSHHYGITQSISLPCKPSVLCLFLPSLNFWKPLIFLQSP